MLPARTDDGSAIILMKMYDSNYSNFEIAPAVKLLFMTLDSAIHDHPPTGVIIVCDLKNVCSSITYELILFIEFSVIIFRWV